MIPVRDNRRKLETYRSNRRSRKNGHKKRSRETCHMCSGKGHKKAECQSSEEKNGKRNILSQARTWCSLLHKTTCHKGEDYREQNKRSNVTIESIKPPARQSKRLSQSRSATDDGYKRWRNAPFRQELCYLLGRLRNFRHVHRQPVDIRDANAITHYEKLYVPRNTIGACGAS